MSKPSLFAFAQANESEYPARLDDKLLPLSAAHRARADEFRTLVHARSTVSINMMPWKLRAFIQRERYLSMQDGADAEAKERGISRDEVLQRQGVYLPPRTAFEGHFEDGDHFLYGALNIGGIGPPSYGIFCAVLQPSVVHALPCAYLRGNSVELYVKAGATPMIDETAARTDAAAPSCRAILATMKHVDELETTADTAWPQMLCCDDCFVEAIFVGEINPASVDQIRMEKAELKRLAALVTKEKMGNSSDKTEKAVALEFIETLESMAKHGLDQKLVGV